MSTEDTSVHSRNSLLVVRLSHVRWWLNSVLERLTPEMIEWAPREGMRTIADQLVEIIAVEAPLIPKLRDGVILSEAEVLAIVGDQNSLESLLQAMTVVRKQTLNYLESLTETELQEEVPSREGWYGTLRLPMMPRAEHFINLAEHEFYHVGQLISYLWMRGDDPYLW